MPVLLSTNLDDPSPVPYFLWDEPMSVAELRRRLATTAYPGRVRLLGKILREARDTDVWKFTTPGEVRDHWPELRCSWVVAELSGSFSSTAGKKRVFLKNSRLTPLQVDFLAAFYRRQRYDALKKRPRRLSL